MESVWFCCLYLPIYVVNTVLNCAINPSFLLFLCHSPLFSLCSKHSSLLRFFSVRCLGAGLGRGQIECSTRQWPGLCRLSGVMMRCRFILILWRRAGMAPILHTSPSPSTPQYAAAAPLHGWSPRARDAGNTTPNRPRERGRERGSSVEAM